MQQSKFDKNQLIGFGLMILLLIGYWFITKPTPEQIEAEKKKRELAQKEKQTQQNAPATANFTPQTAAQEAIAPQSFTLENDKIFIKLSNQGAQITQVELKGYKAYDEKTGKHDKPLYLINDGNTRFALQFNDKQGRKIDLSKRVFAAQQNGNTITFSTQENGASIQYIYTLNGDYSLDFAIKSNGLSNLTPDNSADLSINMDALSQEKGKSWEKRVTDFHYSLNHYSKESYTRSDKEIDDDKVDWIAFKQQFFSTILEPKVAWDRVKLNVTEDDKEDTAHSKKFDFETHLALNGELNQDYTWHFLPLDFDLLKTYKKNFHHIIPFGWGIFGWINEWAILPTFKFMASWGLQYGWVIALLTIVVKLITSPIMYKQYKQSAMMRVLKPDMEAINEKYKGPENQMKRQQETMNLYRTAGVNPLAGCLPALLQIPIFYALFNFFPNVIQLRGKGFLWADDLTAYDSIIHLPFNIPFYGQHVSLFALLYVITMVIYFKFSGNMMQTPKQEGMPDMRFMMYLMPIMFIFFLNSYASGLSWYYFVSNAINIGLVLFIKNVMIDDAKIHAKIQSNKQNPKKRKKSKWQERLDQAMKQAQEQQRLKNNQK
ncbi:membrane protein insertase YidC [Ornithobacterium rhinotracheale]|uniref:Membrane protein insertase YidC n=1 Tax=Ornithobacterium rhinotracheale TaxID=28251 RepID=A0A3R5UVJ4_ORNRH|nr:membrane protein insertase YidC [Ornithobacterium rhinotracheale]QAR30723.1 membrane protein insertase YidC [Ornithobacterium rhinotracheale]